MEPGHKLEFPFEDITRRTVCYYVSYLGKKLDREYHMRTVRARNVYVVTREA